MVEATSMIPIFFFIQQMIPYNVKVIQAAIEALNHFYRWQKGSPLLLPLLPLLCSPVQSGTWYGCYLRHWLP